MPAAKLKGQRLPLHRLAGSPSPGLHLLSGDRKQILYVLQRRLQRSKGGGDKLHTVMLEGSALFEVGTPCLLQIVR